MNEIPQQQDVKSTPNPSEGMTTDLSLGDVADPVQVEYDQQLYEVYQEERRHLTETESTLDRAITTAVLTISGGALGISLTIVKDFNVLAAAATSILLAASWTLLVLALLGSLISLKFNQETHSRFRAILDEEGAHSLDGAFERTRVRQQSCWLRKLLRVADWSSVIACLMGTALLFVFVYTVVVNGDIGNESSSTTAPITSSTAVTAPTHTATSTTDTPSDTNTERSSSRSE